MSGSSSRTRKSRCRTREWVRARRWCFMVGRCGKGGRAWGGEDADGEDGEETWWWRRYSTVDGVGCRCR